MLRLAKDYDRLAERAEQRRWRNPLSFHRRSRKQPRSAF